MVKYTNKSLKVCFLKLILESHWLNTFLIISFACGVYYKGLTIHMYSNKFINFTSHNTEQNLLWSVDGHSQEATVVY